MQKSKKNFGRLIKRGTLSSKKNRDMGRDVDTSLITFKDAEATCVEIASDMKNCFKLKNMLNFNVL